MISDDITKQFRSSLESQRTRGAIVSLHKKLKEEKTKQHTHITSNFPPKLSFEVNEVSQVKRFLFSKIFVVRDDKHFTVQVFARFRAISRVVWSHNWYFGWTYGLTKIQTMFRPKSPDIFPNRTNTCTITYDNWAWKQGSQL